MENNNIVNSVKTKPQKEVGINKLFLHPDKLSACLRNNSDNCDFSFPISIEISPTNTCNLKCVYCSDHDLRDRQSKGVSLKKEKIFELFDALKEGGTNGVVIEGGGEPTIYSDFNSICVYAKEIGLDIGLITNGTSTLKPEILKIFRWIRVSLDASTEEEFFNLKGVNCFEKVLSNIVKYAAHCETIGVGFVVTNNNISALDRLVLRLRACLASYIQLRPVVDSEELYPHGVDLKHLLQYETAHFAVIIDGMIENSTSGNLGLPCVTHGLSTVITASGDVYLCGRLNIYDWWKPIGNLNESNFMRIWNGEARQEQSRTVANTEFCQKYCPQCRMTKFNNLIHNLNMIKTKSFI
jgi:radical SAM protein with 4Fe4S-binding SPASM domain